MIKTSSTEATLSGSFSGASSTPSEVAFYWGTSSSSLTNCAIASITSSSTGADGLVSGSFSATLTGLTPGETYVYQACATVSGSGEYASQSKTFWASGTKFFTLSSGAEPALDEDWLELPSSIDGSRYKVLNASSGSERNYTCLYDTQYMVSLWTAYPLNSSHMGSLDRPKSWSYNPALAENLQPNLVNHSYSGSKYSRGHMIPNGSRNGVSQMQKQTFYVTNSAPQIQNKFNGGIWAQLENAIQSLVKSKNEEVYVVTGSAFEKQGESKSVSYVSPSDDSSQKCGIPNYFYKLVLRVKYSGSTVVSASTIGFWFEHKEYSDQNAWTNYSVSVDQIEEWTGFDFFVNLPDTIENAAESASTSWSQFESF